MPAVACLVTAAAFAVLRRRTVRRARPYVPARTSLPWGRTAHPSPRARDGDRTLRARDPLSRTPWAAPRYPARHVSVTVDSDRLATLGQ